MSLSTQKSAYSPRSNEWLSDAGFTLQHCGLTHLSIGGLSFLAQRTGVHDRTRPWYIQALSTLLSPLSHLTMVVDWSPIYDPHASCNVDWKHINVAFSTLVAPVYRPRASDCGQQGNGGKVIGRGERGIGKPVPGMLAQSAGDRSAGSVSSNDLQIIL